VIGGYGGACGDGYGRPMKVWLDEVVDDDGGSSLDFGEGVVGAG
jgi:hypothetical protein